MASPEWERPIIKALEVQDFLYKEVPEQITEPNQKPEEATEPQKELEEATELKEAIEPKEGVYISQVQSGDRSKSNQLQTKGLRGVKTPNLITGPLGQRQLPSNHLSAENLQALDQPFKATLRPAEQDHTTAEQPSGHLCFRKEEDIRQYL